MTDGEKTDRLRTALRDRFTGDRERYVIAEEVCADSFGGGRADALVLATWRSDRFQVWGVEIKASRGDWKKERANPAKSEVFARYCHRWVVLAWDGVVQPGELPPGWGWWQYDGTTLRCRAQPPRRTPQPLDPYLLAQMARRLHATVPAATFVGLACAAAVREERRRESWKDEAIAKAQRERDAYAAALRRLGHGHALWRPESIGVEVAPAVSA
jgi:hypothetical protein